MELYSDAVPNTAQPLDVAASEIAVEYQGPAAVGEVEVLQTFNSKDWQGKEFVLYQVQNQVTGNWEVRVIAQREGLWVPDATVFESNRPVTPEDFGKDGLIWDRVVQGVEDLYAPENNRGTFEQGQLDGNAWDFLGGGFLKPVFTLGGQIASIPETAVRGTVALGGGIAKIWEDLVDDGISLINPDYDGTRTGINNPLHYEALSQAATGQNQTQAFVDSIEKEIADFLHLDLNSKQSEFGEVFVPMILFLGKRPGTTTTVARLQGNFGPEDLANLTRSAPRAEVIRVVNSVSDDALRAGFEQLPDVVAALRHNLLRTPPDAAAQATLNRINTLVGPAPVGAPRPIDYTVVSPSTSAISTVNPSTAASTIADDVALATAATVVGTPNSVATVNNIEGSDLANPNPSAPTGPSVGTVPNVTITPATSADFADNIIDLDGFTIPEAAPTRTVEGIDGPVTFEIRQNADGVFEAITGNRSVPLQVGGDLAGANAAFNELYQLNALPNVAGQPSPIIPFNIGGLDTTITRSVEDGANVYDITYTTDAGNTYRGRLDGNTLEDAKANALDLLKNGDLVARTLPVDPNPVISDITTDGPIDVLTVESPPDITFTPFKPNANTPPLDATPQPLTTPTTIETSTPPETAFFETPANPFNQWDANGELSLNENSTSNPSETPHNTNSNNNPPPEQDPEPDTTGGIGNDGNDGNNGTPPVTTGGTPEYIDPEEEGDGYSSEQTETSLNVPNENLDGPPDPIEAYVRTTIADAVGPDATSEIVDAYTNAALAQWNAEGNLNGLQVILADINQPPVPDVSAAEPADVESEDVVTNNDSETELALDVDGETSQDAPYKSELQYPLFLGPKSNTLYASVARIDEVDLLNLAVSTASPGQRAVVEALATSEAGKNFRNLLGVPFASLDEATAVVGNAQRDLAHAARGDNLSNEVETSVFVFEKDGAYYMGESLGIGSLRTVNTPQFQESIKGATELRVVHPHPARGNEFTHDGERYLNRSRQTIISIDDRAQAEKTLKQVANIEGLSSINEVSVTSINSISGELTTYTIKQDGTANVTFQPADLDGRPVQDTIIVGGVRFNTWDVLDEATMDVIGAESTDSAQDIKNKFYEFFYDLDPAMTRALEEGQFVELAPAPESEGVAVGVDLGGLSIDTNSEDDGTPPATTPGPSRAMSGDDANRSQPGPDLSASLGDAVPEDVTGIPEDLIYDAESKQSPEIEANWRSFLRTLGVDESSVEATISTINNSSIDVALVFDDQITRFAIDTFGEESFRQFRDRYTSQPGISSINVSAAVLEAARRNGGLHTAAAILADRFGTDANGALEVVGDEIPVDLGFHFEQYVDVPLPLFHVPGSQNVMVDVKQVNATSLDGYDQSTLTDDAADTLDVLLRSDLVEAINNNTDFASAYDAKTFLGEQLRQISIASGDPRNGDVEMSGWIYEHSGQYRIGRSIAIGDERSVYRQQADSDMSQTKELGFVHNHPVEGAIRFNEEELDPHFQTALTPEDVNVGEGIYNGLALNQDIFPNLNSVSVTSMNSLTGDMVTIARHVGSSDTGIQLGISVIPGNLGGVLPDEISVGEFEVSPYAYLDPEFAQSIGIQPEDDDETRIQIMNREFYGISDEEAEQRIDDQIVTAETGPTAGPIELTPEQYAALQQGIAIPINSAGTQPLPAAFGALDFAPGQELPAETKAAWRSFLEGLGYSDGQDGKPIAGILYSLDNGIFTPQTALEQIGRDLAFDRFGADKASQFFAEDQVLDGTTLDQSLSAIEVVQQGGDFEDLSANITSRRDYPDIQASFSGDPSPDDYVRRENPPSRPDFIPTDPTSLSIDESVGALTRFAERFTTTPDEGFNTFADFAIQSSVIKLDSDGLPLREVQADLLDTLQQFVGEFPGLQVNQLVQEAEMDLAYYDFPPELIFVPNVPMTAGQYAAWQSFLQPLLSDKDIQSVLANLEEGFSSVGEVVDLTAGLWGYANFGADATEAFYTRNAEIFERYGFVASLPLIEAAQQTGDLGLAQQILDDRFGVDGGYR